MQIVFNVLMALWLFSEFYYRRVLKSDHLDDKGKDKSSLNFLWVVFSMSIFLAIFITYVDFGINFSILHHQILQYFGLFLIFISIVSRYLIIKSLGKFFTVDVTIKENHQLKTNGIYKIIRHPTYTFVLLTFLGLGFYLNNWISLFLVTIAPFLALNYRIKIEENALIEKFGTDYLDYKKQTKKLIPYFY